MGTSNHKRLKSKLKETKYCYWCDRRVKQNAMQRNGIHSENTATLDHIFPKLHKIRILIEEKFPELRHKYTVLSCHKCNSDRNKEFHRMTKDSKTIPVNGCRIIKDLSRYEW